MLAEEILLKIIIWSLSVAQRRLHHCTRRMISFGNLVFLNQDGTEAERLLLTKPAGPSNVLFIKLKHPGVSYEHCRVDIHRDGEVFLTNLSQTHPTLLNNKPVTRQTKVVHKDYFTILDRSFRFELQPDLEHSPKKPNQPNQHREKKQSADPQLPSQRNCKEHSPKKPNQPNQHREKEQSANPQLPSQQNCVRKTSISWKRNWKRVQLNGQKVCTEWDRHRVKAGYDTDIEFAYHLLRLHERTCPKCDKPDIVKTNSRIPTSPHHIDIETGGLLMRCWNADTPERTTPPATPPNIKDTEGSEGNSSEGNTGNPLSLNVLTTTNSGSATPDIGVDTPVPYFCSPSKKHMGQQISQAQINRTYPTSGEDNVGPMQVAETIILDEDSERTGIITISDDSSDDSEDSTRGNSESVGMRSGSLATGSQHLQQTSATGSSNSGSKQATKLPLPEQSQQTENRQLSLESPHGRDPSSALFLKLLLDETINRQDSVAGTSSHQMPMNSHNVPMNVIQSTSSEEAETLQGVPNVKQTLGDSRKMANQKDPRNDRLRPIKKRKILYAVEENNTICNAGVEGREKLGHSPSDVVMREQESSDSPSPVTLNTSTSQAVTAEQHVADLSLVTHQLEPHSASTTLANIKRTNERENCDVISPVSIEGKEDNCSTFADLVMEVTPMVDLQSTMTKPQEKRKTNNDLFMCHECNLGFGDCWSCLVLHNTLSRTVVENPTKCNLCETLFNDTETLRRHMHDIHGIERFTHDEEHLCPDCLRPCTPCNP